MVFGFFGSKTDRLKKRYARLLAESFRLSTIDRKQSDIIAAEADKIRRELDSLEEQA